MNKRCPSCASADYVGVASFIPMPGYGPRKNPDSALLDRTSGTRILFCYDCEVVWTPEGWDEKDYLKEQAVP